MNLALYVHTKWLANVCGLFEHSVLTVQNKRFINAPNHGCAANVRYKALYITADFVTVRCKTTKRISRSLRSYFRDVEDLVD